MNSSTPTAFDDWFYEQCGVAAAELVGPNSREYEAVWEEYYENAYFRRSMRIYFEGRNRVA